MIELLDKNILKVLTIFSLSPGSRLKRNLIKEKTAIPNIVLDKTLSSLINFKIIIKENSFFVLNYKNEKIKEIILPIQENYAKLKQLPLKEYFIISDIKTELSKTKYLEDVYLFGSYAKLIFKENSDIDIAIISNKINKENLSKIIRKLEKKHKKKIELHYFSKDFYKNKRDSLVKEILQHGTKLI